MAITNCRQHLYFKKIFCISHCEVAYNAVSSLRKHIRELFEIENAQCIDELFDE
jgi:hypothetical protein